MRIVYLGTSGFAAAVLERLAGGAHRPALVVTRPDQPRGRGRKLASPPVADAARALELELYQPENVNDDEARARIAEAHPDAVCVCAFGALLREPLLSEHELISVHPSLLPRWRGAAPVERAVMAGDERTGVAIMQMEAGLDTGAVYLLGEEPIAPDDTYGTLAARLQELASGLLVRTLDERPQPAAQSEDGVTYADKIEPQDRTLDPAAPAQDNDRRWRALTPHIGARAELADGSMLGVVRARVVEPDGAGPLRADRERLLLGGLELLEVQPAGGLPMDAAAYLRGHGL